MRTATLLLAAAIAMSAMPVRAEEAIVRQQRGFLSGLGIGLIVGGLAGIGAGVGGTVSASEASVLLRAYGPNPASQEQVNVTALQNRVGGSSALAVLGLLGGSVALAGGVVCLVIDSPTTRLAFVPTSQGGVFVFSGRF